MTCVAYRDKIIAADTMATVDDVIKLDQEIKVAKRKGYLFGICGNDMPKLDDFIRLYFSKEKKPMKGFSFDCMVITPAGKIEVWDQRMRGEYHELPFFAVGSGAIGALCAMEVGADATQAVQATIKWCPGVGGKVVTRKL